MVFGKITESELERKQCGEQEYLDKTHRLQNAIRKKSRWSMYMSWYKRNFLREFPCMRRVPQSVFQVLRHTNKIAKSTLVYVMSHTTVSQMISIGVAHGFWNFRVFRKMYQFMVQQRDRLDRTLLLERRMGVQSARCSSLRYVRSARKLAAKSRNHSLVMEVNRSYIVLRRTIAGYSL
ncbi:MAG: hypothetical protein P4M11_15510 [Candidatus Pacebacteria bacterium]|nr:hypothetical protein [Candidatus Paceibacterota bacterium]